MYNLPGTRMPCLHILRCSSSSVPSPASAKSSFASNFVHEYLTNQPQQGMWKVILLLLILPNIQVVKGAEVTYQHACNTKGLQLLVVAELPERSGQWCHIPCYTLGMLLWRLFSLRRGCRAAGAEWWVVSHREMQWGHTSGHLLLVTLSSSLSPLLDIQPCLPKTILSFH